MWLILGFLLPLTASVSPPLSTGIIPPTRCWSMHTECPTDFQAIAAIPANGQRLACMLLDREREARNIIGQLIRTPHLQEDDANKFLCEGLFYIQEAMDLCLEATYNYLVSDNASSELSTLYQEIEGDAAVWNHRPIVCRKFAGTYGFCAGCKALFHVLRF